MTDPGSKFKLINELETLVSRGMPNDPFLALSHMTKILSFANCPLRGRILFGDFNQKFESRILEKQIRTLATRAINCQLVLCPKSVEPLADRFHRILVQFF